MIDLVSRHHDAIAALCRQYGVLRLDLLTENMIRNRFVRQSVETMRQHVYDNRNTPAAA